MLSKARERSKSREPKRDLEASSSFDCYYCRKLGYIKKNCMKCKDIIVPFEDMETD